LIPGLTNIDDRIEKVNLQMDTDLSLKEKLWIAAGNLTKNTRLVSGNKLDGIFNMLSTMFPINHIFQPFSIFPLTSA
jgi:proline iminopeptidase